MATSKFWNLRSQQMRMTNIKQGGKLNIHPQWNKIRNKLKPWNISRSKTSFTSKREVKIVAETDTYLTATSGSEPKTSRPIPCPDSPFPTCSVRELSLPHPTKTVL